MRGAADFSPNYESSYFLPREEVKPSPSLLRRVWPQLDQWKEAHLGNSDIYDVEPNNAAGGFLILLKKLREDFLQVSLSLFLLPLFLLLTFLLLYQLL